MRIAVTLIPTGDWNLTLAAARRADTGAIDAIGLWDHFHSNNPDEALVGGWSAYGALALATQRIRLTPMVLNQLSYPLSVLAKESAALAIVSDGRFELGVGLGGWAGEHERWGQPFPDVPTRIRMLEEKIRALRELWRGEPVTFAGEQIRLEGATARPAPPEPPRVVVGGNGHRLIRSAATYANELNLLGGEPARIAFAREAIAAAGRNVAISVSLFWTEWPGDGGIAELDALEAQGVDRVFVNLAAPYDLLHRLNEIATARMHT